MRCAGGRPWPGWPKPCEARGVHPAECVVLLPYAQLIQQARQAWAAQAGDTFFVPRFETTMNWAGGLGGTLGLFTPSGDDLRMDMAVDMLTAASLLGRAGLGSQQDALAGRLVEAAWSLAGVAPPSCRPAPAWSEAAGADPGRGPRFTGAGARSRRGPHRAGLGRCLGLPDGPPVPGQAFAVRRARRLPGRPAHRGAQGAFRRPVAVHPAVRPFEAARRRRCTRPRMPKTKPAAPPPACWPTWRKAAARSR
jgi:hypothetical protein